MPWKEAETNKRREVFFLRALEPDVNLSERCREHENSRKTGDEWPQRLKEGGTKGLLEQTRRPHSSPLSASGEAGLRILKLRRSHARLGSEEAPRGAHAAAQGRGPAELAQHRADVGAGGPRRGRGRRPA